MSNYWLQRLLNGGNTTSQSHFYAGYDYAATPQQVDSFLANSLAQLNVEQRESALEELHGIRNSENPESNPDLVDLWLEMLDKHLQNNKRFTVYEIAEVMDRSYVNSRSFRMMFLRASRYDPEAAANKVFKFLDLKRSLFGQEKLTKKITLADLSEEDKEFLESGAAQVSKERDSSGRPLIVFFPSLQRNDTNLDVMLRARYYVSMNMIESSEESQKSGIVFVYFGALPAQPNQHKSNPGALWDLPIFFAGIHCCLDELGFYLLVSLGILRMPKYLRPRIRVHYGSCTECLYKLSSFGIPRKAIMTDSNEPRLQDHAEWYSRQQQMEAIQLADTDANALPEAPAVGEIVPGPNDVLFGPASRKHQGNLVMRDLVLEMLDEHNESRKGRKMQLTESVIDEIKKNGGRFLKQNEETKMWQEASHVEVARKIAHTFRNIRRPKRTTKKA